MYAYTTNQPIRIEVWFLHAPLEYLQRHAGQSNFFHSGSHTWLLSLFPQLHRAGVVPPLPTVVNSFLSYLFGPLATFIIVEISFAIKGFVITHGWGKIKLGECASEEAVA
jgi:hypothetical protein